MDPQQNRMYMPEKEQEQFILQNAAELYSAVERLVGKPVVEDALSPGKSHAGPFTAIETTISKVWSRMREARAKRLAKGIQDSFIMALNITPQKAVIKTRGARRVKSPLQLGRSCGEGCGVEASETSNRK